jgi:23S rRNA (adenine2503-C2)-methyltransferase
MNVWDPRDQPPDSFLARVRSLGLSDLKARKLTSAVIGQGIHDPAEWGRSFQVPKLLTEKVSTLPRLKLDALVTSPIDGFQKLRFRTLDDLAIETVLIPLHKPEAVSVCLSSQVGCAMACAFCATARMPTRRNLATWEIIDQWVQARDLARTQGRRVTGAVFMGMGEPFLNYDRVIAAAELLRCSYGGSIGADKITISTVGLVPEIDRYTLEGHRFRLSISLGAATDDQRKACISGQNVSEADAKELGTLIGDTPVRLDLIDVTDPTGRFHPPTADEMKAFRDALTRHLGQPVVRRYSGGKEILAACGTLAGVD